MATVNPRSFAAFVKKATQFNGSATLKTSVPLRHAATSTATSGTGAAGKPYTQFAVLQTPAVRQRSVSPVGLKGLSAFLKMAPQQTPEQKRAREHLLSEIKKIRPEDGKIVFAKNMERKGLLAAIAQCLPNIDTSKGCIAFSAETANKKHRENIEKTHPKAEVHDPWMAGTRVTEVTVKKNTLVYQVIDGSYIPDGKSETVLQSLLSGQVGKGSWGFLSVPSRFGDPCRDLAALAREFKLVASTLVLYVAEEEFRALIGHAAPIGDLQGGGFQMQMLTDDNKHLRYVSHIQLVLSQTDEDGLIILTS